MNIDEAIKKYRNMATKGNAIFSNNPDLAEKHNKEHEASEEAKREEFITGRKKHNEKVVRMSNRPQITAILSLSILKHICPNNDPRIYWAKEVTFDWATSHSVRVDFMKFKPVNNTVSGIEKGDFYCYEVKSSVDDFHSKNGHNFIGDYNYYVMPEEVYEQIKQEIPYRVGVYVPAGMNYQGEWYDLKAIKKAKRQDRNRPVSEMLLMMFRSAARERSSNGEINKDL